MGEAISVKLNLLLDMGRTTMPPRKLPRNIVLWAPAIAIAIVLAIWAFGAIDFLMSP
jgi:hypothetical protein